MLYQIFMNVNYIPAKLEEARAARVLFAIVMIFVLCILPRTILNLEECVFMIISYSNTFNFLQIFEASSQSIKCYSAPYWSYFVNIISQFLLTINASVGSIIYCVVCLQRFKGSQT